MGVVVTDPRASQRQLGTWVDRQTHDEFEILARESSMSKAEFLRRLIEDHVRAKVTA